MVHRQITASPSRTWDDNTQTKEHGKKGTHRKGFPVRSAACLVLPASCLSEIHQRILQSWSVSGLLRNEPGRLPSIDLLAIVGKWLDSRPTGANTAVAWIFVSRFCLLGIRCVLEESKVGSMHLDDPLHDGIHHLWLLVGPTRGNLFWSGRSVLYRARSTGRRRLSGPLEGSPERGFSTDATARSARGTLSTICLANDTALPVWDECACFDRLGHYRDCTGSDQSRSCIWRLGFGLLLVWSLENARDQTKKVNRQTPFLTALPYMIRISDCQS
mmetsp:Transcript_3673/g.8201  ORF Transcript_3673/g.8201 Transcript_3673/m.8201 type:complete len:273 (-) Transcript_3673:43-861(-)